eukprot:3265175-Prorocentrum_lima.AAC.1
MQSIVASPEGERRRRGGNDHNAMRRRRRGREEREKGALMPTSGAPTRSRRQNSNSHPRRGKKGRVAKGRKPEGPSE